MLFFQYQSDWMVEYVLEHLAQIGEDWWQDCPRQPMGPHDGRAQEPR